MKTGIFTLDNATYHITHNDHDSRDSLHRGTIGYDQRNWTLISHNAPTITYMLTDYAFEGYPGSVITYATFAVTPGPPPSFLYHLVSIPLGSTTPLMVITHPYFNLDAFTNPVDPTILHHTLSMPYSPRFIEIDNVEVPTGALAGVHNTPLNFFSAPKTFGRDMFAPTSKNNCGDNCTRYDNSFIIDRPLSTSPESTALSVLTRSYPLTGIKMELYTNQQTLLIYTCNKLNRTIPSKRSQEHAKNGATTYIPSTAA
jgi:aldose 1-epimerase